MKVIIEAERKLDPEDLSKVESLEITMETIGSEAWVQIAIGDQIYEVGYQDFWNAARSVCIEML